MALFFSISIDLSGFGIIVSGSQHIIRRIKIFKVMAERFRLKKEEYESVFLSVCGLVRLRIGTLIIEHQKKLETGEIIDVLLTHIFSSKLIFP
jgi:hypothetical protein